MLFDKIYVLRYNFYTLILNYMGGTNIFMSKYKVRLRGGFSDRNEIKIENKNIQYKDFDQRSRIALSNGMDYMLHFFKERFFQDTDWLVRNLVSNLLVEHTSSYFYSNYDNMVNILKNIIMENTYDDVLTTIEYTSYLVHVKTRSLFYPMKYFNEIFQKEFIGYRFVENQIVPITNDLEIDTINTVINENHDEVSLHIKKALTYLSDRMNPDYENSIKESIMAIEALANQITGEKSTLGALLTKLDKKGVAIHGSLKEAFKKLYGYTSDAHGIRHAGNIDGPFSTFEEAKFMLVVCCAFINYVNSNLKN